MTTERLSDAQMRRFVSTLTETVSQLTDSIKTLEFKVMAKYLNKFQANFSVEKNSCSIERIAVEAKSMQITMAEKIARPAPQMFAAASYLFAGA